MKRSFAVGKNTPTASLVFAALTLVVLIGSTAKGNAQAFQPGEILVSHYDSSRIQRYSASGTLLQTFSGTGILWFGASLTPDGGIVTAYSYGPYNNSGINIFRPDGTETTFALTGNAYRGDVSVFADGTLAVNDQISQTVQFWSQTGSLLKTVSLPGLYNPFGSAVGSDGLLYVAGSGGKIARVNSDGSFLGSINLSFQPGDLVMNPVDGTLWVSGYGNAVFPPSVHHIRTDGTVIGSFETGLGNGSIGIDLAPDYNSLYVTSQLSSVVKHFDLGGNLLDSFDLTHPGGPGSLTVVPTTAPEPGSAMLLLGGLALLAARSRRIT